MITYVALSISVVSIAACTYLLLKLREVGNYMEQLSSGLTQLGNQFKSFSDFILTKLPQ